jgi:D-sedoheptulose 7-phosphate isomerase
MAEIMRMSDRYRELKGLLDAIKVFDGKGKEMTLDEGAEAAIDMIGKLAKAGRKMMFIGNGASASIASHQSTDFFKNGDIRAGAFNDPALLTCMGNDYGYPHVFEKPVEMFADEGDLLVAISSSGRSENILNAANAAKTKKCGVITLSGFNPDNPLSKLGDLNFYAPAHEYGHVEIVHHSICHYILDIIVERKKEAKS